MISRYHASFRKRFLKAMPFSGWGQSSSIEPHRMAACISPTFFLAFLALPLLPSFETDWI
jgi:hypothetical protein